MHADISSFLRESRSEIIKAEVMGLGELHAPHYDDIDSKKLQERVISLVDSFLDSLDDGPAIFVQYLQSVAEERFREGFFLEEIQAALNILGEEVWSIIAERAQLNDRVEFLGKVSTIIGAAKDRLAHVYIEKLKRSESRVALLQKQLDELFAGTVPGPDADEVTGKDVAD
jgi:hypothetical protein